jgi:branched-subunit amino acid transport protein
MGKAQTGEKTEGASGNVDKLAKLVRQLPRIIVHPFAFAALPILGALWEVKKLALPEEIIPSLAVSEIAAGLLFLIASLITRSASRGAIISSLTVGLFFSYRMIAYALDAGYKAITGQPAEAWLLLSVYLFLSAICVSSSTKTRWDFGRFVFDLDQERLSKSLNVVSIILLVFNSIPLVQYEIESEQLTQKFVHKYKEAFDGIKLDDGQTKPDVYYVIVDGFANRLTMQEMFHTRFDQLYDFLKIKNFYVVPEARSNYDRTEFSLAATFNMQYIDDIPASLGKNFDDLNLFCRMIQDSAARRMFKRLGYKFVNVSSGDSATDYIWSADKNIRCCPFNHFTTAVSTLTPLYATEKYFPVLRDLLADMRLCPGDCLKEIVDIPGPKFVLIHTEISHAPCIFDENGHRLPLPSGSYMINWGTPEQVAGQWKYSQKVVSDWLSKIIDMSHGQSVVIIHSDHGSGIPMNKKEDWYNERMRILNALYLPGKTQTECYATMTPVNNLRIVFNTYFNAKLPLLPDRVMCAPVYVKAFDWIDVQNKLNFAKQNE